MKIFKYQLAIVDDQTVVMPSRSKVLSVQFQSGNLCMWALVDPKSETATRDIRIIGTGNQIDDSRTVGDFIGTVQQGRFVLHVFDTTK